MKPHTLSASFPSMSDADFTALVADIKQHGQRDPITTFEGMVLDGWHRWQACAELNLKPWLEKLSEDDDPAAFVLSRNLHRRHLSASQRALAVTACREWRPKGGKVSKDTEYPLKTVDEMAKEADVSPQTIKDAKTVIKAGRADEVRNGTASLQSIARPAKAKTVPPPEPEPEPEAPEEEGPDLAKELEDTHNDNIKLQKLVESLSKSDSAKEIKTWKGKYEAANGRINQLCETEKQLKSQLSYQTTILASVRKLLDVKTNNEILSALKEKI